MIGRPLPRLPFTPGFRPGSGKAGLSPSTQTVSHHAYQLYAHITWHTWKRVGCINGHVAADVKNALESASRRGSVRILRSAVLADHVHVLASYRPDTKLSDFIRLAKTISAFRANRRIPGAIKWARGFYVTSYHKKDLPFVAAYIRRQTAHHPDRIPQESRQVF